MLYQKFLSPRKKHKCAKGVLYQNGTCSSSTKEAFKKDGFIAGMKEYKKSTKECKKAYKSIKNKENKKGQWCDALACSGCAGGSGTEVVGSSATLCEMGSCATAPCDVASC